MKKNKIIKIAVIIFALILISYYIFSILFTRNGQFVNYHFPAQLSVENSIYNNNFIREISPDKIDIIDSLSYEKIGDNLEIYLCEAYYYKNYGIFNLLTHRMEFDNSICLNVNSKNRQKIFIEYNDGPMERMGNSNSYWNIFKIGSDVNVKFFNENKEEIFEMTFLELEK